MHVLICGGGVAGLTAARALAAFSTPAVKAITIVTNTEDGHQHTRGLGLWNNSQVVLDRLGLGEWLAEHQSIPSAAYRSTDGLWLSRCSPTPSNLTRVKTVLEADLLAQLQAGLAEMSSATVDIVHDSVMQVQPQGHVTMASGKTYTADLVVGADGVHSVVRRDAFVPVLGADILPTRTGNTCVSTIVPVPTNTDPFEALGVTGRFAAIPVNDSCSFWFATVPDSAVTPSSSELSTLFNTFGTWCDPIPRLLEAAEKHDCEVRVEPLYRCAKPVKTWNHQKTVLIGDALHMLPPNLAQGSSVAIEDAWELACAVADVDDAATLSSHLSTIFQQTRHRRALQYRQMTAATSLIGALGSTVMDKTRRLLLMSVPSPINSTVFDMSLYYSLGSDYFPTSR